jgi:hypothetical protein
VLRDANIICQPFINKMVNSNWAQTHLLVVDHGVFEDKDINQNLSAHQLTD